MCFRIEECILILYTYLKLLQCHEIYKYIILKDKLMGSGFLLYVYVIYTHFARFG